MSKAAAMNRRPAIDFEPFLAGDLGGLQLRREQGLERDLLPHHSVGEALQATGLGWTARVDGQVAACAGFLVQWPGRATAWALIGEIDNWRAWPAITRKVAAELDALEARGFWRIEATVRIGFAAGTRWLKALGFERRCLLPAYDPAGNDVWLFDRINYGALPKAEAA
jgi:hypothetical protein